MRVPLELEHLVRSASDIPARSTLSSHLAAVESRKALEVEHYLRACAIRLEYEESRTSEEARDGSKHVDHGGV